MVEDARHMVDVPRGREARCQVVVLRAVESAAQASQPPEELLADRQAVQHVHDRVQVVRGPVRLVVRLAVRATGSILSSSVYNRSRSVVTADRVGDLRQSLWVQSSSWSRRAMNSPVACSAARLVAPEIPRDSSDLTILMRDRSRDRRPDGDGVSTAWSSRRTCRAPRRCVPARAPTRCTCGARPEECQTPASTTLIIVSDGSMGRQASFCTAGRRWRTRSRRDVQ